MGEENGADESQDEMLFNGWKPSFNGSPRFSRIPQFRLSKAQHSMPRRLYTTSHSISNIGRQSDSQDESRAAAPAAKASHSLPHLTPSSQIHVVSIAEKAVSHRVATAVGSLVFSNPTPLPLVRSAALRKGDVLAVARVAGVLAAKRTAEIVPLCHSGVGVEGIRVAVEVVGGQEKGAAAVNGGQGDSASTSQQSRIADDKALDPRLSSFLSAPLGTFGGIRIAATVECSGKTGVEMEALCAVAGAGLSALDMVKGVDKGCVLGDIKAVRKSGSRSGEWELEQWDDTRRWT